MAPPAGPGAPAPSRFREEADFRPREPLLIEPPRRLWPSLVGGAVLFLGGGVLGMLVTVELLGNDPPARPALSGAEAPPPATSSAAPEQVRREAERMQANAELAALRQAAAAERNRLEALAVQRDNAEAELAALRAQAEQEGARQEQRGSDPVGAVEAPAPAAALPAPPPPAPTQGVATPPPAARPPSRARAEARADPRPEGRVVLHYLAGSAVAQQAAEDAAAVLRDAGVEGVEMRPAAEVPGNRLVRYHRAEDAGTAARLAGRLGRGWALQDNRGYDPGGAARGLEVWLPDR